jgi:hypothetical protein
VRQTLFQRTTECFVLTEAGSSVLALAEQVEDATLAMERRLIGQESGLEGNLRISASEWFGTWMLPRVVEVFSKHHPMITLELLTGTRLYSLGYQGASATAARMTRNCQRTNHAYGSCPTLSMSSCQYDERLWPADATRVSNGHRRGTPLLRSARIPWPWPARRRGTLHQSLGRGTGSVGHACEPPPLSAPMRRRGQPAHGTGDGSPCRHDQDGASTGAIVAAASYRSSQWA